MLFRSCDAVPPCGPLGGVLTAFQRTRAARLGFLSCDLPLISPELIRAVVAGQGRAIFTSSAEGVGFPFALDRSCRDAVVAAIRENNFSLQAFAQCLRARRIRVTAAQRNQLLNVNTPADFARAKALARVHAAR